MIDVNESILSDSSIEKEPCEIRIAESYLRGFARHPADRGTSLMPEDARWIKGARKLYDRLSDSDRDFIDSFASDENLSGQYRRAREKRLKYLAMLLLIEAGKESIYSIILPYGESDHGKDGTEKTD